MASPRLLSLSSPTTITTNYSKEKEKEKEKDENVLESFESDPAFAPFLSPSFSPSLFSSAALSSNSAASTAESLHESIRRLHLLLRRHVLLHHPSLLRHLSSLRLATSLLSSLRSSSLSLNSSYKSISHDLTVPRRTIETHTLQLSNLHSTFTLIHGVSRLLKLSGKLHSLVDSSSKDSSSGSKSLDLAKAAEMYREIEVLYEEHGLRGISVVDAEIRWLSETGSRLRSEAIAAVEKGMDEMNQNDIWCGLQVFFNLGELRSTVDAIVNKYKAVGVKRIASAMDLKAISSVSSGVGFGVAGGPGGVQRSGTPQIGGGKRAGEALWERMTKCMDELHKVMMAVWQLQSVLSKKRVPFTQVLFLHEVWQEGDPFLTDRVWGALAKAFASQMKSVFTASSFVKEVFTHGYPKLFTMVENLIERIERDTNVRGVLPAVTNGGKDQMVAAIEVFQMAFLAQCLSRLSDYVNSIFPMSSRGTIPSKDQISRIVLRVQEEIEAVKLHGHLMMLVLHEIQKVLMLLAQRAEYQVSTGPESRQVTGPATPAQIKNFALCQHLQEIHMRLSVTASSLPSIAAEVLSPPLGVIYGVACDSVTALFQSMLDRLESCILRIHEQDFGSHGMDVAMDNNASAYMDEIQKSTIHFRAEFLSKLIPSSAASRPETICTQLVRRMASRVLSFFIRHAALVRPLSESGKLRMARDMAELELAVGQNLFPVEQLGAPYRALRAFRPVIFLETSQLAGSPLVHDLPPSVILHHLYSRGPEELQSPMQRNNLTPLQYSLWLDSQGEDQIWKEIKATLHDYEMKVRDRGDKEFSPVYPLMLQIGATFAHVSSSQ